MLLTLAKTRPNADSTGSIRDVDDFSDLLKLSEKSLMAFWSSKADDVWDTI
ncbi:hypothetical protein HY642_02405 [Candidatus Woesearchaeota archaeon]|nr:hypothetical protein [Candidatus Woesearchaeota archaeon]